MTELKQVDPRDIKKQITICGVKLYGENAAEFFCDCEISASEHSECVVFKIKGTNSAIKIKKSALLGLMGYPCSHTQYYERI